MCPLVLGRAVASLEEADGYQLWEGAQEWVWYGSLFPPREFGRREPREKYIYNAKSCILVHFWFRKLAAVDRRGSQRHG